MSPAHTHAEPVVAALCLTLERYPWRSFTPPLLARLALAQWDRCAVERLLAEVPGSRPGLWREVEPAPAGDPRVAPLVALLTSRRWRQLTANTVCRQLVGLLDAAPR